MDGSNPVILVTDKLERPEAITIDIESKTIYFSTQYPPVIQSIDTNGGKLTTILTAANNINLPKAISVMGSRLYYLDPSYENLVQVALPSGNNPRSILENEPDLKTFTIFKKRTFVSCPANRWSVERVFRFARLTIRVSSTTAAASNCAFPMNPEPGSASAASGSKTMILPVLHIKPSQSFPN